MVEQQEDQGQDDQTIESLSPEQQSLSEARGALLRTMLTPLWWIFGLLAVNVLVGMFPSGPTPDSTFVHVTWSIFALMFPFAGTWSGVRQARRIREYDTQTGLWLARSAAILGVIFGIASLAIVVGLFLGPWGGTDPALTELAQETCATLDDMDASQAGPTIIQAIDEADSLGFAEVDLTNAMREECPSVAKAIDAFLDGLETRMATPSELVITTDQCSNEGASGTVTNNFGYTVRVILDIYYFNKDGTILDVSIRPVDHVSSDETGTWEDKLYTDTSEVDTCEAVMNVYFEP